MSNLEVSAGAQAVNQAGKFDVAVDIGQRDFEFRVGDEVFGRSVFCEGPMAVDDGPVFGACCLGRRSNIRGARGWSGGPRIYLPGHSFGWWEIKSR